ncbi:MAG: hypothetical protein CV087_09740 [Candidatus Brocadia sp. WS118]|nr:MAG: hypothetical protein CV087_09740 [Candidatus Brocadia sp. WS118]
MINKQQILLEQYRLYVEMADRISSRRTETNKFYVSILSGILALLLILVDKNIFNNYQAPVFIAISLLGFGLNVLWYINIRAYRQLNSGKFQVIKEMELQLPFPCYDREWELLGGGKETRKYLQISRIEQYVPFILFIPYLILLIYSLLNL